jgi:penicillin-binding protein 1A
MSEIYQRRPSPPDWPRPDGLVVREIDKLTGLLRSPFCPDSDVVNEFYIEGTEPVQQCAGVFGAAIDSTRPAPPPAPFGQPIDPNAVRPHAAPVPAPAAPTRDTVRIHFDPFHPGKP